jgi:hypothetical protein
VNKVLRWVLILGALIFFVQSPGEVATLVTLAIGLGEQLVRALAQFVSQLAGALT